MIEGEDRDKIQRLAQDIAGEIEKEIGVKGA
jgi:hypothetical protein